MIGHYTIGADATSGQTVAAEAGTVPGPQEGQPSEWGPLLVRFARERQNRTERVASQGPLEAFVPFHATEGQVCLAGLWVVAASLWLLFLMGIDKRRARNLAPGSARVWESTFLAWAVVGGAPGGWLGMHLFRHKTRHLRFRIVMPLFAIIWVLAVVHLCGYV